MRLRIVSAIILAFSIATAGAAEKALVGADVDREIAGKGNGSHRFFVAGFQRWLRISGTKLPTEIRSSAFSFGYQYGKDAWHIGANFSSEYSERKDSAFEIVSIKPKTPGFTAFGGYRNANDWRFTASTFAGFPKLTLASELRPYADYLNVSKTIHNTQLGASMEVKKTYSFWNEINITPHFGLDYSFSPEERYEMSVNLGGDRSVVRTYDLADDRHFLEGPMGLRVSKIYKSGMWSIEPHVDATVINAFKRDSEVNAAPGYASFNGEQWKTYGVRADNMAGKFKFGVDLNHGRSFDAAMEYYFERRERYVDHRLAMRIGLLF